MEWLNYHHLLYFWTVVREGGVSAAARKLRLAQPTVSGQLRQLEHALGERLLERKGRRLELTEVGQVVYRYAEEIFALGRELQDTLHGRATTRPLRLTVGVADVVPKLVARELLEPLTRLASPVQLVCLEDRPELLLAELALHRLDLVLSDAPASATAPIKAFSHPLGETGVSFFAAKGQGAAYRRRFPRSLEGAPLLLPAEGSSLRRSLDGWLDQQGLHPRLVAEFQDSALMSAFGQAGAGLFPGPTALEAEIEAQYGAELVGRAEGVRERFYAITVERKIKHPAILALSQIARRELFRERR